MPLVRTSAPAAPAVPLNEVLEYLRVTSPDDEAVIAGMLSAATGWAEEWLERALVSQGWRLVLDEWPRCGTIRIDRTPVIEVTSIGYTDPDGIAQQIDPADWLLDGASAPARLSPAPGTSWPAVRGQMAAIRVDFQAGYGDSWNDVPEPIRQAIMRLTAHFYDHRDTIHIGGAVTDLPFHIKALLAPYRAWRHR
jgi:uncharacterized phiE125 gp8 family phage protein